MFGDADEVGMLMRPAFGGILLEEGEVDFTAGGARWNSS